MVAAGFLRLVTNAKVFLQPMSSQQAWAFLTATLSVPGVRMATLGAEWGAFGQLCRTKALMGDAIPDAWIAAAVKSSGLHLVTFDRDFGRLLDASDYTLLRH